MVAVVPPKVRSLTDSWRQVWGVTIGGAILQNALHRRLPAEFLAQLPDGAALAYSAIPLIKDLDEPLRTQVREAFADGFKIIWQVMTAVAGLGLISALFMKALPLHTQLDENWGIDAKRATSDDSIPLANTKSQGHAGESMLPEL